MKIKFIEGGILPKRMSPLAAGFDVYARDVELLYVPADIVGLGAVPYGANIKLGFAVDCSVISSEIAGFFGLLLPRSGWGDKYGFRLRNTAGVIDADYRGEVEMRVEFDECPPELSYFTDDPRKPLRVGQIIFMPYYAGGLQVVEDLSVTERGDGGFGSTGV